MTWSVSASGSPDECVETVSNNKQVPPCIKVYIIEGIEALETRYGMGVKVRVSGSGHLFNGEEGWHPVTSANVTVEQLVEQDPEG